MGKKTKLFALTLAMSMLVVMTLSLHARACYNTTRYFNDRVEITTIIGFQNQTWHYVIKNINFPISDVDYFRLGIFIVYFLGVDPVDLVSNISSPPDYVGFIRQDFVPGLDVVLWRGSYPFINQNTQKAFSFQTNKVTGVATQNVVGDALIASLVPASLPEASANAAFVNALLAPTITAVEGLVEVQQFGSSDWLPASVGMTLSIGDKVRTNINSHCTLEFDDGSIINMQPDSWLRNAGNAQGTIFLDTTG